MNQGNERLVLSLLGCRTFTCNTICNRKFCNSKANNNFSIILKDAYLVHSNNELDWPFHAFSH